MAFRYAAHSAEILADECRFQTNSRAVEIRALGAALMNMRLTVNSPRFVGCMLSAFGCRPRMHRRQERQAASSMVATGAGFGAIHFSRKPAETTHPMLRGLPHRIGWHFPSAVTGAARTTCSVLSVRSTDDRLGFTASKQDRCLRTVEANPPGRFRGRLDALLEEPRNTQRGLPPRPNEFLNHGWHG
jgi:hypothetical protein